MQTVVAPQNFQHLLDFCATFLVDKYNISIAVPQLKAILQSSIGELMQFYRDHPPFPVLDEFNKRTIIKVKDKVLLMHRESVGSSRRTTKKASTPPPKNVEEAYPTASDPQSSQVQQAPLQDMLPPPSMDSPEEDADEFAKKLQQLELQRSASIVPAAKDQQQESTTPSPPFLQAPAPTPPPPSTPTVLFVPTVTQQPRIVKSLMIHGADRMWDYFHERNAFVWAGPTPESSTLSVASLQLPSSIADWTPVVELHIAGAGGQTMDIHCVCKTRTGCAWDVWVPCSTDVATLRTIACPWNIQVRDALHQPIPIGSDGFIIESVDVLMHGNSTRIKLSSTAHVRKGSILMVKRKNGDLTRHRVIQVSDHGVEIEGEHTDLIGSIAGLWDMQCGVLLEVTKNETSTQNKS